MSFPDRSRRFPTIAVLLLIVIGGLATAAYFLRPRFESEPPQIKVTPEAGALGLASRVEILVTDVGTGLRSVTATLSAGGAEHSLASEQYRDPVREKKITLDLSKLA